MKLKKKRGILIGLILISLILIAGIFILFTSPGHKIFYRSYQYICEKGGNKWVIPNTTPYEHLGYCYQVSSDEGKECYKDSECEAECVVNYQPDTGRDENGFIVGKCGQANIHNCKSTIPVKTKDAKDLGSGSCI